MNLIDGKKIAADIKAEIREEVENILSNGGRPPHLAAILVGNDAASHTYVANKEKACAEVGMMSSVYRLPEDISQEKLLETIAFLNSDNETDGLIVQLPLPDRIAVQEVIASIDPKKDVDGFHPVNIGKMVIGEPSFLPATPMGISMLLERSGIETVGKHCVVVGRSNIVGTPMSIILSRNNPQANCTVTLCHSRSQNMEEICRKADILIVAIGKCEWIDERFVKEGATIIDVGMHRVADASKKSGFALKGDVKFDAVKSLCENITPVPGGVGPMTITGLLLNTLKAYQLSIANQLRITN